MKSGNLKFLGPYGLLQACNGTALPLPLLHHLHLAPWIRSFDLFRHRHIAIVCWGVHDLFFLDVCSWGRVSGSLVLSVLSRWLIQFCSYLSLTSCIPEISSSFLMTSLLILSSTFTSHIILMPLPTSFAIIVVLLFKAHGLLYMYAP